MDKDTSNLVPFRHGKLENNNKYPSTSSNNVIDADEIRVNDDDEVDLKTLFGVVIRRRWLIASIAGVVLLLSLLYTLSITPLYKAEVTLRIDQQEDRVVSYDVYEQKQVDSNFYETQINVLRSRALARRVIDELGLESFYEDPQLKKPIVAEYMSTAKESVTGGVSDFVAELFGGSKGEQEGDDVASDEIVLEDTPAVDLIDPKSQLGELPLELKFLKGLLVKPVKGSNIVSVSYQSPEPELSASIANTLAESFIKLNLETRGESSVYAEKFLKGQLAIIRSKLEKSEIELVEYAKNKQIIHTDDKNSIISSELQALSAAYIVAKNKLIEAESTFRQKNKVSGDMRLMENAVINKLKEKLLELESKYTELSQTYKSAYPQMVELRNQITAVNKRINKEEEFIQKGSSNELESLYLAAKENASESKKQLDSKKAEILSLRDKSIGYQALKREVDTNRELYDGLLQRVKEVGVASGAVSNNVSILDYAYVPFGQASPNNARNVLMGFLLGLMLGVGVAFLLENMDDSLKTAKDVELLTGLPIIGYFPFTKIATGHTNPLLIHEKPFSAMSEAFRSTIFDLQFSTEHGTPKLLHITSSTPDEGKSCSSINLSTVFAQEGKRTLLIDCDLRKPSMHGYLDMHNDKGLTNVLVGQCELEEAYQKSELIPNFTLLPAGVSPSNPVKLLASESMLEVLNKVAGDFDQVILDSPPVLGMADALILSNRAHATLFVVSSEGAKKAGVADALKRLDRGYGNVIGVMLTKVKNNRSSYYGYDGYYSYGHESTTEMTPVQKQEKLA